MDGVCKTISERRHADLCEENPLQTSWKLRKSQPNHSETSIWSQRDRLGWIWSRNQDLFSRPNNLQVSKISSILSTEGLNVFSFTFRPVTFYHTLKLFQLPSGDNPGNAEGTVAPPPPVIDTKKRLVSEFYDEIVFHEPSQLMQQMLNTIQPVTSGSWTHDTDCKDSVHSFITIGLIQLWFQSKTKKWNHWSKFSRREKRSKLKLLNSRKSFNKHERKLQSSKIWSLLRILSHERRSKNYICTWILTWTWLERK